MNFEIYEKRDLRLWVASKNLPMQELPE